MGIFFLIARIYGKKFSHVIRKEIQVDAFFTRKLTSAWPNNETHSVETVLAYSHRTGCVRMLAMLHTYVFLIRDVHLCHECESNQHVAGDLYNVSGHQRANRPILPFPCSEGKPTPPVQAKLTQWNRSKCTLGVSRAFCVRGQAFQCSNVSLLFRGSRKGWVFIRKPFANVIFHDWWTITCICI